MTTDVKTTPYFQNFKKGSERSIPLSLSWDIRDDPAGFGSVVKQAMDRNAAGDPFTWAEMSQVLWKETILTEVHETLEDVKKCKTIQDLDRLSLDPNVLRLHERYWVGFVRNPTGNDHFKAHFSKGGTSKNTELGGLEWWEADEVIVHRLVGKNLRSSLRKLMKQSYTAQGGKPGKEWDGKEEKMKDDLIKKNFGLTGSVDGIVSTTAGPPKKDLKTVLTEIGIELSF